MRHTYKNAGVDIDIGNAFVEAIKPIVRSTKRNGADTELGGFGGLFDLKEAGYRDPILVGAADGVGTKLRVAISANKLDSLGIDLVAMCVNDLVVRGAEPLFFLDYYATGKLEVETGKTIIQGIADGCKQASCALIGGETAEMPGMYVSGDFDLAGFAIGVVERGHLLTGNNVEEGDVILGLASSGLHANGYSLVRKIVKSAGIRYDEPAPFDPDRSLGEALLEPTKIYVNSCLSVIHSCNVKALAHITGGSFDDNIPRVLPKTLRHEIDINSWPLPAVFRWLAETGKIAMNEMFRTFNCGIGMIVVVSPDHVKQVLQTLCDQGETVFKIGLIVPRVESNHAPLAAFA